MRGVKQLVAIVLLSVSCVSEISWTLALQVLSDESHAVSLSALSGSADIVLHHHDASTEGFPRLGNVSDHDHDDHVIHVSDAVSVAATSRVSFSDGPATQYVRILPIDVESSAYPVALFPTDPRPIDPSPPRSTIVLRI